MPALIPPRLFLAGVLVSVWAVCGCTPNVKNIRSDGIDQFRSRQYVESTATLQHALELNPNDAQSNYYMGLNYRAIANRKFRDGNVPAARRELDTAIVYFRQAIKSWPNYMAAVAAEDEALKARGKYEEAMNVAERVADNNRGEAEHFVYLGNEYRDRGDYDNALRAYKKALAANPASAEAYTGMGKLYERIGDGALAADAFRRAHELEGGEPAVAETPAVTSQGETRQASHTPGQ